MTAPLVLDRAQLVAWYRATFLAHEPPRHALMLPPGRLKKYDDRSQPITDALITAHLDGSRTLAAPAARDGLACLLPLDVDAGGLPAIRALLDAAHERGWFAFGEYTPRPGLEDQAQRGYVYLALDDLASAERLQLLGRQLVEAVLQPGWAIEIRAHGADTRLPLGRHTHTGQYAELWLAEGQLAGVELDRWTAIQHLWEAWTPNTATRLPALPDRPSKPHQTQPRPHHASITAFNQAHDVEHLLERYGAKKAGTRLYLCPFHDDRHASLGVFTDQQQQKVARCWSQHSACPLATHGRYDAFNIFCLGEGLTAAQAIRRLAEEQTTTPSPAQRSSGPSGAPPATPPNSNVEPAEADEPDPDAEPAEETTLDTQIAGWLHDRALQAYLQAEGSSGVLLLHRARQLMGEDATNRQVNAQIQRLRGKPFSDRHLRALHAERRALLIAWRAHQLEEVPDATSPQSDSETPPGATAPAPGHAAGAPLRDLSPALWAGDALGARPGAAATPERVSHPDPAGATPGAGAADPGGAGGHLHPAVWPGRDPLPVLPVSAGGGLARDRAPDPIGDPGLRAGAFYADGAAAVDGGAARPPAQLSGPPAPDLSAPPGLLAAGAETAVTNDRPPGENLLPPAPLKESLLACEGGAWLAPRATTSGEDAGELSGPGGAVCYLGGAAYVPCEARAWYDDVLDRYAPPPPADDELDQLLLDHQQAEHDQVAAETLATRPEESPPPAKKKRRWRKIYTIDELNTRILVAERYAQKLEKKEPSRAYAVRQQISKLNYELELLVEQEETAMQTPHAAESTTEVADEPAASPTPQRQTPALWQVTAAIRAAEERQARLGLARPTLDAEEPARPPSQAIWRGQHDQQWLALQAYQADQLEARGEHERARFLRQLCATLKGEHR